MRHLWRAFAFQLATLLSKDFLRAVRHSKAVIKVWFIILLLAYMTEFALRLNVLKAEYESNVEFSQLFRSLHERIATSPQCEHTSPSSSACASGISKITVRVTLCQNENIKRVFECLEPLFASNGNVMGRHGPLPTPFAAYLRCCGTPQDPFLKRIAFLTELNTKLVSLCDALLDVQIIEKCNCINSDVKSAEFEMKKTVRSKKREGQHEESLKKVLPAKTL